MIDSTPDSSPLFQLPATFILFCISVITLHERARSINNSFSFVTGHGECPPEDCGGVCGYADLLKLTQKKKLTAEERERLEWYQMDKESEFDPDSCDIDYFKEIAEDYNDAL